ncbi:hypothetical protein F5878DRAFT_615384 [Lentinula raphanica]|uniref:Uncharacterized protein n=1 Tax=Lentinula raphanica TaxID=153919 RepID=A0AA38PB88_9AGAR|nr:hypothetical protein F5878DRAFT_615384 [Lentinula raphanica]
MSLQVRSFNAKSCILGIVLLATLTFTVGGSTAYASPLPPIPPGQSGSTVALDVHGSVSTLSRDFNFTSLAHLSPRQLHEKGSSSRAPIEGSSSQQPTEEDDNSSSSTRTVVKKGSRLFQALSSADRLNRRLDTAEYTFIGYGYAFPNVAKQYKGKTMPTVADLTLANPDWSLTSEGIYGIYLLPQIMPEQNPTKLYWTCPVYAKTDMIEESKKKQKASFKGKSKTDDPVVGPMRSTMRYNELEPYYPEDPNYLPEYSQEEPDHQHVIDFFKSPNFPNVVAMRIPKDQDHKYIQAWGLLARCYDSPDGLTMKAPWEEWRASIKNLPEDVALVPEL